MLRVDRGRRHPIIGQPLHPTGCVTDIDDESSYLIAANETTTVPNWTPINCAASPKYTELHKIDDFGDNDAIAAWVETKDGKDPADDQVNIVHGAHSAVLGLDTSADVAVFGQWINVADKGDLSAYISDNILCWFYVADITKMATAKTFYLKIGSSASDFTSFVLRLVGLTNGWNVLNRNIATEYESLTGITDWENIDWIQFRIYEAGTPEDYDVIVNHLAIGSVEHYLELITTANSGYVKQTTAKTLTSGKTYRIMGEFGAATSDQWQLTVHSPTRGGQDYDSTLTAGTNALVGVDTEFTCTDTQADYEIRLAGGARIGDIVWGKNIQLYEVAVR